ncbi:MAG: two-component regulator propeller domain-containing protein [Bacteroidia bacterium]
MRGVIPYFEAISMKYFFCLLLCTFTLLRLTAQQPYLRHFTVNDGLPSSFIYTTFQDSKGYLWISTDRGIVRYNGYHFQSFSIEDGLPYHDIWGFFEDKKGNIWCQGFLTYFVYYSYDDHKFHALANQSKESLHSGANSLHEWKGGIWAATTQLVHSHKNEATPSNPYILYWGKLGTITQGAYYTLENSRDVIDASNEKVVHHLQTVYAKNKMSGRLFSHEKEFYYWQIKGDSLYYDEPQQTHKISGSGINVMLYGLL